MKASSFWDRFWAYSLDVLILFPVGIMPIFAAVVSPKLAIFLRLFLTPVGFLYAVYFISNRGQTIGKRVLGLKVVRMDGTDVSRREAVLRSMIDLFFAIALGITAFDATMGALALKSDAVSMTFGEAIQFLNVGQNEGVGLLISILSVFYAIAQLICFFATPERRFIHDFVAGTRVIKLQNAATAAS